MSGRDPWESQRAFQPDQPRYGLFSGPNLPFTLTIVVALVILAAFIVLVDPFASGTAAAPTTTTTAATDPTDATGTTVDGTGTTVDGTASTSSSTTNPTVPSDLAPLQGLALETVVSGLGFPVFATSLPGDPRIFILERGGLIRVADATGNTTVFLDLTDRVGSGGIENGLLGLAFHPDYATNGRFFVYYTDLELDSRLSEFRSSGAAANTAPASSERVLFEVDQQGIRHRAGMLEFGPDGDLWIALGDGGLGDATAQDVQSLQGSILRIDVDNGDPYSAVSSNPYANGVDGRPEIWAHGLRNPWRFDIDDQTRTIYIADVGQETWEEVNVASIDTPGLDFGWPNFEADECFLPSDGCGMTGWESPVVKYNHDVGCSITGGYVYRGSQIPELVGHYFYADWCNGMVRSFKYADGAATEEQDWTTDLEGAGQVASFGVDGDGELLLVNSNGVISRIVPVR